MNNCVIKIQNLSKLYRLYDKNIDRLKESIHPLRKKFHKEFYALKDINFDGPVVIESFTAKVKSIARAAAIWRPLAPTQDAIAVDGLKFLRQLLG